jgi:DNA-binding MarR family transcriptional regulator
MTYRSHRFRGFECLCGNLRMAARAVTALYDDHLAASGLTAAQLTVLWCAIASEPVAMGEIGRKVAMDKSTVTRNVAALVAMGLLRAGKGTDARHRLVSSTVRGRGAFERAMPAWRAAQADAARLLGSRRLGTLARQSYRAARAVARAHEGEPA